MSVSRLIIFLFLVFASPALKAQTITQSEYDGFTGEHNIQTSIVSLKRGYTTGFGISLRCISNNFYLTFIGYGKNNTLVNENERIQFLFKDGTILKFPSRVQLLSNESPVPNLYIHHYFISKKEVEVLAANPPLIMRVVSETGYNDIAIPKKGAKDLVQISKLFLAEMNKY